MFHSLLSLETTLPEIATETETESENLRTSNISCPDQQNCDRIQVNIESENLRTSSFFISFPAKVLQNTVIKMLNIFCFSRSFRCATANGIRRGSD